MSMRTREDKADWILTTFDRRDIYLTQEEFEIFEAIIHPSPEWASQVREVKFLAFEDGGIAISDIRSYEKLRKTPYNENQIADGRTRERTPEEIMRTSQKLAGIRKKLEEKGILSPKPLTTKKHIS